MYADEKFFHGRPGEARPFQAPVQRLLIVLIFRKNLFKGIGDKDLVGFLVIGVGQICKMKQVTHVSHGGIAAQPQDFHKKRNLHLSGIRHQRQVPVQLLPGVQAKAADRIDDLRLILGEDALLDLHPRRRAVHAAVKRFVIAHFQRDAPLVDLIFAHADRNTRVLCIQFGPFI